MTDPMVYSLTAAVITLSVLVVCLCGAESRESLAAKWLDDFMQDFDPAEVEKVQDISNETHEDADHANMAEVGVESDGETEIKEMGAESVEADEEKGENSQVEMELNLKAHVEEMESWDVALDQMMGEIGMNSEDVKSDDIQSEKAELNIVDALEIGSEDEIDPEMILCVETVRALERMHVDEVEKAFSEVSEISEDMLVDLETVQADIDFPFKE